MKQLEFPSNDIFLDACRRPALPLAALDRTVRAVMEGVRQRGDAAVLQYTSEFDGVSLASIKSTEEAMRIAGSLLSEELRTAIDVAARNIETFHAAQAVAEKSVETMPGVTCWRAARPIESVGLYVPGGTAPLFSTVLMLAIPARLAGCSQISLCSPPDKSGAIHPAILYAASVSGVRDVYTVGGAQAIAALAYGTESIPRAYKIFGPGNQYVTRAKQLVAADGIAVDMPAGPTELAIVADENASPAAVAADVLSQAEHGPDSQVVLLSHDSALLAAVADEIAVQLARLPRRDIASAALANSLAVLSRSLEHSMELSNEYAPEHLILAVREPRPLVESVRSAGSVFLGYSTPESVGDYASGTNHTLPTNGAARAYSGVSLESFQKKITFQELSPAGLLGIGPAVMTMASAEGLEGHARAVAVRVQEITGEA